MIESIVEVLMRRDKMSRSEAEECVTQVHNMFMADMTLDPEEICRDEFGLEPDYIEDILFPPHHNK